LSVSFEFSPNTGKVAGVVKDVSNEIPLSSVQILAIGENGNAGQDTTGVDGRYELTSLAPDTYLIKTVLTGYLTQESTIEVEPETSETLDVLLEKKNIRLDGFVLDQTGKTLADIQVRAVTGDQIFQTYSLEDGSFAIMDLPPDKITRLSTIIVSQGYDNADTTITIGLDDISDLNMTVTVHRVSISGTTGEPAVKIIAQHQTRKTIEQTYSNAEGAYTLEKLYPGTYEISAEKEGFISPDIQTVEISNPYDAIIGINFIMETGSIILSGRVISRSAGLGIENAPVSIWSQTQSIKTKTDAEGSFSAENLPPKKDYIIGTALDSRDFDNADTTVAVGTIDFDIGEILIEVHNCIIKGSISDDLGNLLGNAYMTFIEQDTTVVTGAQGNFRLPHLFAGNYTLNAAAVGYNDTTLTVSVSEFDSTVVNISLLPKVSSLFGTVKYQNLELENVIVTLSTANDLNVVGIDTTNSKGYYSFDNLEVGTEYRIAFTKTGFQDNTFQLNTLDTFDISMLPFTDAISGSVVLEDGKTPVENVEIFARTQLGDEFLAFSDDFGDFAILSLPPGTYTLVAPYSDSLASPAQIVELEKDASIRKILTLKKTAALSGVVLADGKYISGSLVTASN